MSSSPIIVQVTRGLKAESFHQAFAVVVDEEGKTIFTAGDENYVTCFRSSLKPFQASAAIKCGATVEANFSTKEIALMCASHSGEKIHTETAKGMLLKLGFTLDDYECGAHQAFNTLTHHSMIKSGAIYSAIHNNCSGKHAGMLCLAKHLVGKPKGYISENHPVHTEIFKQVIRFAGKSPDAFGIDGCSVPTPFYDLKTIAMMFQKLGSPKHNELAQIYNAMCTHPYLVAGKDRFDTVFMKVMNGAAVSKGGGEAIQGISLQTKKYGIIGISLKVIDGSHRARDVAIISVLESLNLLSLKEKHQIKAFISKPILNHNDIQTGKIEVV